MECKCSFCGKEIGGLMFAGTDKQGNKHEIQVCFECIYKRSKELEYDKQSVQRLSEKQANH